MLYVPAACFIGLRFELLQTGIIVEEDVGTVELCITYGGGDNVPLTIDAAFQETYGKCKLMFFGIRFCSSDYYKTSNHHFNHR